MKKSKLGYFLAVLFAAFAAFSFFIFYAFSSPKSSSNDKSRVRVGSVEIPVEIAKDLSSRIRGLSGRASLDFQSGMLFVFGKPDFQRFWMPKMNFPIDIIWINDNAVVDITPDVSNEFDPFSPAIYAPSRPAQYVLEVNAGFAKKKNIEIGSPVSFIDI